MSRDVDPRIINNAEHSHEFLDESKKAKKKLNNLKHVLKSSQQVLLEIKTVFPFTLFPDSVKVDMNKVDIIHRFFFFAHHAFTIMIKDLVSAKVTTGLLFAALEFEVRGYEKNPNTIKYLRKSDAIKARSLIMGLIAAKREGINITKLSSKDIKKELLEIGDSHANLTESGFGSFQEE